MKFDIFPSPTPAVSVESSAHVRERMLAGRGERRFVMGWHEVLMIHFEVDAIALQRCVPLRLDLWQGRAFVSLTVFTMRGLRPAGSGAWGSRLFRPFTNKDVLNVRTYVRHDGEPGIHFLAEWLNSQLAAKLAPIMLSQPYRHGQITYQRNLQGDALHGQVTDPRTGNKLAYEACLPERPTLQPCPVGTFDEWLMERYLVSESTGGRHRRFRIWHKPWLQCLAQVNLKDTALLRHYWPWFDDATLIGANYSPGFDEVWMDRPQVGTTPAKRPPRFRHGVFFGQAV